MINHFVTGWSEKMKTCICSRSHWQYSILMHQRDAQRHKKFLHTRSSIAGMKIPSVLTFYQPNTSVTAAMWDKRLHCCKWAVRFMVGWTTCAEFQTFSRQQSRRHGIGKSSPRICACWFNVSCCQSDPAAVPVSQTHSNTIKLTHIDKQKHRGISTWLLQPSRWHQISIYLSTKHTFSHWKNIGVHFY